MTYDDRNWELRWSQERRQINLSRAIAVDMESGTIAAQGYRLRVPYGTLLCVSDKPLHGEIKLPGAANAFYERAVGEHLMIGLAALDILRDSGPPCTRASCAASTSRPSGEAPLHAPRTLGLLLGFVGVCIFAGRCPSPISRSRSEPLFVTAGGRAAGLLALARCSPAQAVAIAAAVGTWRSPLAWSGAFRVSRRSPCRASGLPGGWCSDPAAATSISP